MPENALAGGKEDIGGNKPADFGVIVPALEVVEPGFLVRQSSDCRYRHIHGNGRDYSFRVWKRVSPRLRVHLHRDGKHRGNNALSIVHAQFKLQDGKKHFPPSGLQWNAI